MGTCDNNHVWVAPVNYVTDANADFYWYSNLTAQHSRHIAENPSIAFAIFDASHTGGQPDGVQITAHAALVPEHELSEVMQRYWEVSFPDPGQRARWQRPAEHFRGEMPLRFYRATPTEVYKLDTTNSSPTRRVPVSLDELKEIARVTG